MASTSSYQYSALPDSKSYIRLLALRSLTSGTDELCVSLEIFPISEAPPYEALSYAWGDQIPTSSFTCNSATVAVTSHLLEGLQQIRDNVVPSRLWVDAICINQTDVHEKADQIPLMTQIYSQATRVLVWLGHAADGSDTIIDQTGSLLAKLQTSLKSTAALRPARYVGAGLPAGDDPFWKSLAQFWSRSWFDRLWVQQEVMLAKEVLFVCGNRAADIDLLSGFAFAAGMTGIYRHIESIVHEASKGRFALINLSTQRRAWTTQTTSSSNLLQHGRSLKVREPVDRVYALLGVMKDWVRKSIKVDYTAEARQEYWRMFVSIGKLVMEKGDIRILSLAESYERPPEMPSWVPNWNSDQPTQPMANSYFNAGFHGDMQGRLVGMVIPTSNSIKVPGFELGTIVDTAILKLEPGRDVSQLVGPEGNAAQSLQSITDALASYRLVCDHPEEHLLKRFARTLMADACFVVGEDDPEIYVQDALKYFILFRRSLSCWAKERKDEAIVLTADHVEETLLTYENLPVWRHRCMFFTKDGQIGFGSRSCRPGDIVCVLFSAQVPYILRKVPDRDSFLLVSDAYADGVMYGEALEARDPDKDRDFIID